jgi:hypothetical protein
MTVENFTIPSFLGHRIALLMQCLELIAHRSSPNISLRSEAIVSE